MTPIMCPTMYCNFISGIKTTTSAVMLKEKYLKVHSNVLQEPILIDCILS